MQNGKLLCSLERGKVYSHQHWTYLPRIRLISEFMCQAFRRGECRSSCRVRQEGVFADELVAHAQVCNLDFAGVRPQQIARLQVSVNDLLIVN